MNSKDIIKRAAFDLFMNSFILIILNEHRNMKQCGLPILDWCFDVAWFNLVYSTLNLNVIWLKRFGSKAVVWYVLSLLGVYFISYIWWFLYVIRPFLSSQNDCQMSLPMFYIELNLVLGGSLLIITIFVSGILCCMFASMRTLVRNAQQQQDDMNEQIV